MRNEEYAKQKVLAPSAALFWSLPEIKLARDEKAIVCRMISSLSVMM